MVNQKHKRKPDGLTGGKTVQKRGQRGECTLEHSSFVGFHKKFFLLKSNQKSLEYFKH